MRLFDCDITTVSVKCQTYGIEDSSDATYICT